MRPTPSNLEDQDEHRPTEAALVRIQSYLLLHAREQFPLARDPLTIDVSLVRYQATNPLRRFTISDGTRKIRVIGKWAPVYPNNNEGLTEFLHYNSFGAAFPSAVIRCPKALGFLHAENVLLTEEYPGVQMHRALKRLVLSTPKRLLDCVRLGARWLAAFHELHPYQLVSIHQAWPHLERAHSWLSNAQAATRKLRPLGSDSLTSRILSLRDSVLRHSAPCRVGGIHGDFGPSNILTSKDGIVVLDVASNAPGPQLLDVAAFVAYLRILPMLSARSKRLCDSLEEAFLSAYADVASRSSPPIDHRMLSLLVACQVVRNLDRHMAISASMPQPLRTLCRAYLVRNYRRTLLALPESF